MVRRGRSQPRRRRRTRASSLDVDRADAELLEILDADFAEARRLAGDGLKCGPGCADCCYGPFPITRLDVERLRRGLAELSRTDPPRPAAIERRARDAVAVLTAGFPGEAVDGRLTQDESVLDAFFERHARLACPALDPATQTCDLHPWRPVACRTYGPPVRFGNEVAPPCDLCFRGAGPKTVERCRIEPDRDGLEQEILIRMGVAADEDWETLIAWALGGD
jgi:Fe-S-cluster containining protein